VHTLVLDTKGRKVAEEESKATTGGGSTVNTGEVPMKLCRGKSRVDATTSMTYSPGCRGGTISADAVPLAQGTWVVAFAGAVESRTPHRQLAAGRLVAASTNAVQDAVT
jgi:hypothetical protein